MKTLSHRFGCYSLKLSASGRLQRELELITRDPPSHCSAGLASDDIFKWQGTIMGPDDTPFEGGIFFLSVRFPRDYPWKPPKVKFLTKVYHPNIDGNGDIHVDMLKEKWYPALTIDKVLLSLCSFLTDPNTEDSLNPVANLYNSNRKLYNEKARTYMEVCNELNHSGI